MDNKNEVVTKQQMIEFLGTMQEINNLSKTITDNYLIGLEFIKSKNLMAEFRQYFNDRIEKNKSIN